MQINPAIHLFDDFIREDGNLGISPSGHGWDLRGPYVDGFPLPPANDGAIRNHKFVVLDTANTVYAAQHLPYTPTRVGMRVSWEDGNGGANDGVAVLIISKNDNLVTDMLHLIISPTYWAFQIRESSGSFDLVQQQYFSTPLQNDISHIVECKVSSNTITIRVNSNNWFFTDARISDLLGEWIVWELAHDNLSTCSRQASIDAVWTGQNQG